MPNSESRRGRIQTAALQYGWATFCVAIALIATESLNSVFPTPLFFLAIVASTWFGGVGPGVLSIVLGTIALDYYFVPPVHQLALKLDKLQDLVLFAGPGLLTCWLVQRRKEAESSLRQAHDELERKVQERTSELRHTNEQLQAQIAERIRAEEVAQKTQADLAHITRVVTMGEMAASIAHEINQPLMAMTINADACLQWLERKPPELTEARSAMTRIVSEGNRAGEIIQRIRALFRKSPTGKSAVNINDLIREIVELARREAARNGVSLAANLADRLPAVVGDHVQLQQVILNLTVNAIEALSGSNRQQREVRISSECEQSSVVVTVQDSGPGFLEDNNDRMFDAFFTTKPGGLGMGLSVSRSILEAHGGRLRAWNTGDGAVFQFRLPLPNGPA